VGGASIWEEYSGFSVVVKRNNGTGLRPH